jgi:hypothetical protein
LSSFRTAQSSHSGTPHVHVRDHTTDPSTESVVFLVSDVELAYKIAERTPGSITLPCSGKAQIVWGARAVTLEPETHYHAAMDVHGEKTQKQDSRRYDLDLFVGDTCVLTHRFNDLALGTWELSVSDPIFQTTCQVELKKDSGKVFVNFTKSAPGCREGLISPSAVAPVEVRRGF